MQLDRKTIRVYYQDFYLQQVAARVVKVGSDYVELDRTIAYPEGGGQESDTGYITFEQGPAIAFTGAQRMHGTPARLPEFPDVQVDGVIWHMVAPQDAGTLNRLAPGARVEVSIDIERRARLSLSHTASHFLFLGVARHRPDVLEAVLGCHIRLDGARFDFAVEDRFSPQDLERIEQTANDFIERDAPITFSAHPSAPDARRWHCEGLTIPCGGTHLDRAGRVGPLEIQRKRLGAGKERLACKFPNALPEFERYHRGTE